jgi:hypothetical protein
MTTELNCKLHLYVLKNNYILMNYLFIALVKIFNLFC